VPPGSPIFREKNAFSARLPGSLFFCEKNAFSARPPGSLFFARKCLFCVPSPGSPIFRKKNAFFCAFVLFFARKMPFLRDKPFFSRKWGCDSVTV